MNATDHWEQINITFADWASAEPTMATKVAPFLRQAQQNALLHGWFYVRKHPHWRIRFLPQAPAGSATGSMHQHLNLLINQGQVAGYQSMIYEPEIHAFGGPDGMAIAHHLFHLDSDHLLHAVVDEPETHRRERAVLLTLLMLRASGLDWFEQGDVWARVADHRPLDHPLPTRRILTLEPQLRPLLMADASTLVVPKGVLTSPWTQAFTAAGQALADLAATGRAHRGLRALLTHHIVFAWNRHGLPYATQALLARTAQQVVFGPDPTITEGDHAMIDIGCLPSPSNGD